MPIFTPFNFPFNTNELVSDHLQKKMKMIMMNAKHSVTKVWLVMGNISIKDLIVSLSGMFLTCILKFTQFECIV